MRAKLVRLRALVIKETRQVVRDPSSIAIGVVLPLILIVLFGYGLSLDVKNVPVALVLENPTPEALDLASGFQLSPYFHPLIQRSMPLAVELLREHKVDGIVRLSQDFSRRLASRPGTRAAHRARRRCQPGSDHRGLCGWSGGGWAARRAAQGRDISSPPVSIEARLWFNEANDSSYFLVPGLIVLVMTLIGGLLTAMVMAREWERGTLESLLVTPVRQR